MLDLYTCSLDEILSRRRGLRKDLISASGLQDLRIAVLGGSTTSELVSLLELLLLADGFRPVFHQGEYGRFYEESVHDFEALQRFGPDLIYLHTSYLDVREAVAIGGSEEELQRAIEQEVSRFRTIWDSLEEHVGCQVIQNNFELAPQALLGNLDAVASGGQTRLLNGLNERFALEAMGRPRLLLQDVNRLSAQVGLRQWFDWSRYFNYKILQTAEASLELARSLNALVRAVYGRSRKVLVLDLDNTLWGGVIGDDGVDRIQIGRETPTGEAYTSFQEYCLRLRGRGVLLAVCSKNTEAIARQGFEHPSSVLRLEHFACFKANWEPKPDNLLAIAAELNLGVDSFVFVDDNPAEREIVRAQLPRCAVPEVGDDVSRFAEIIDRGRYFEAVSLSEEDLQRSALYAGNSERAVQQAKFASYGEYLDSLEMTAEIETFRPVYLDRIAQLTNKTNQFNLTTRRYSVAEMQAIAGDPGYVGLYGRLSDRFGDNGLISVVLGRGDGDKLHLDLWLMSCRVLKREMEFAMLDAVAERAVERGFATLYGYFVPTAKNGMVADFYERMGFATVEPASGATSAEGSVWRLELAGYRPRSRHIRVLDGGGSAG